MASTPRWTVKLCGHPFDLEDLPDLLEGSPLAVDKSDDGWILSPTLFTGMTDVNAVMELAEERVRLLSGLHRCIHLDAGPITVGSIELIDENGRRNAFAFVREVASVRAKASLSVIRNGRVLPDDNVGRLRRHANLGVNDPVATKLLRLLAARPATWSGLYRIFDLIEKTSGGTREIENRGWATVAEMESFTGTANHPDASGDEARHGAEKGRYTRPPMDLGTAVALVRRLVSQWLDHRIAHSASDPEARSQPD